MVGSTGSRVYQSACDPGNEESIVDLELDSML